MTDKAGADDLVARGATAADLTTLPRAEITGGRLRDPLVILDGLEANPPPAVLRARLKAFREMLNGADPLDRAVLRDPLIRRLEALGVRSPAALANAALAADQAEDLQGGALELVDPEPWPEPVDGAALLDEITRVLQQFIALPKGAAVAIALWGVYTHAHAASEVSPILAVTSPTPRCGKTTLLTILSAIVPRALSTSNISPSAVFRTIEKFEPTLLIDEADTFVKLSDETRGILNAAHTRSAAWVVRNVGEEHEPRRFSTWCPKAVALIGKLPDTLRDRSIEIPMRRRSKGEQVKRFRTKLLKEFEPLRRRAARWAKDHLGELEKADPAVPEELDDRAQDNWRPLLAIAELVGGVWPTRAREAAKLLSGGDRRADASAGVQLLDDIRGVFACRQADRLASVTLVDDLVALEERPWREWRRGRPLTQRQLAQLLAPFDITPGQLWIAGSNVRGYEASRFADAFSRYLPPLEPLEPLEPNGGAEFARISNPLDAPDLADRKQAVTTDGDADLAGLADRKPVAEEGWGEV